MINIAVCDDEKCMSEKIKNWQKIFSGRKIQISCCGVFFGRRIAKKQWKNRYPVATRFPRPIITLVACHRINRYNDMRTEKGKSSRTPIFVREPCPGTIVKTMVIISRYEVEYKKDEDIFNQQ